MIEGKPKSDDQDDTAPDDATPDDVTLLQAHVAGDADAFGVLVARHQDRMWRIALRIMRNPEDAADALQDAYLAAFRRAGSYRGEAQVTTWLHRVVLKACLDRLRNDGDDLGRMMSIGLHPRITGNPARSDALARFVAYAQQFEDVAFMRRIDIARTFADQVPRP